MSSISSLLLDHLNKLTQDDLERFKSALMSNMAPGCSPIPHSKLEEAEQISVVELMVNQYGPSEAANITVQVLKRIKHTNLASDLEKNLQGQVQVAVGVSSCSSQTGGVSLNISADDTSNIQAPILSGGKYDSPLTLNFNTTSK